MSQPSDLNAHRATRRFSSNPWSELEQYEVMLVGFNGVIVTGADSFGQAETDAYVLIEHTIIGAAVHRAKR